MRQMGGIGVHAEAGSARSGRSRRTGRGRRAGVLAVERDAGRLQPRLRGRVERQVGPARGAGRADVDDQAAAGREHARAGRRARPAARRSGWCRASRRQRAGSEARKGSTWPMPALFDHDIDGAWPPPPAARRRRHRRRRSAPAPARAELGGQRVQLVDRARRGDHARPAADQRRAPARAPMPLEAPVTTTVRPASGALMRRGAPAPPARRRTTSPWRAAA